MIIGDERLDQENGTTIKCIPARGEVKKKKASF